MIWTLSNLIAELSLRTTWHMTYCMWYALNVLHVICTRLCPGHLSICVRDGSQRSEENVKYLELRLWMRLLLLLLWWRPLSSACWYHFWWPWPSFKVTVVWENNFCVHFIRNFSVDLDEIQYLATTGWLAEARAKIILHKYYARERGTLWNILLRSSCVRRLVNRFVSNCVWC